MEDKDKIIISAYLDNDLSEEEIKYVDGILANDAEAKAYFNRLKSAEREIEGYYEKSLNSKPALSAFEKLEQLKISHSFSDVKDSDSLGNISSNISSLSQNIFNVLKSRLLLTNLASATAAAFSIFVILDINSNLETKNNYQDTLSDYDSSLIQEFDIIKTRGLEDDNHFRNELIKVLSQMLEKKILNSKIKYGSENFFISLDEQIHSDAESNTLCFRGLIYSTENSKFIFCSSNEDNSLLISN